MNLSRFEKDIIKYLEENSPEAFSVTYLARHFQRRGSRKFKQLVNTLSFLERIGRIQVNGAGRFRAADQKTTVVGTYRGNDKGFGFISYDEEEADLFVPPGQQKDAMDGDKVQATIIKQVDPVTGKGSEARVTQVMERAVTQLVGEFHAYNKDQRQKSGYLGFVTPQGNYRPNTRILIREDGIRPADNTIVIVKISEYPTAEDSLTLVGLVAKEIGHRDEPGVDIQAILYKFEIPHEFPDQVIQEANQIAQEVSPKDMEGRRDLRDALVITIDGADAKDLDDAIQVQKNPDGTYQLGVHIADVSHYVQAGSAIDHEAYERGNSVYLTDRVVPMLPQRLSNGICSLHPHEDRLTLSCDMTINQEGQVIHHEVYHSVINSKYRMTYDEVNAIYHQDSALRDKYQAIVPMLEDMKDLHEILEGVRHSRGALGFDVDEAEIVVDEEGHPLEILLRQRDVGERLIESFMLAANETIAHDFTQKEIPFIFRIHEYPDSDRIERLAEFLTSFGVLLHGDTERMEPHELQAVLELVKDQPFEQSVASMLLRSMKQARYFEEPVGHYGLAAEDYTHFTSPIRRYSDLIVHRLISAVLNGRLFKKQIQKWEQFLPEVAEHVSMTERRAIDAERETDALKKAEYMMDKIGEEFEGVIGSVTSFGMFVELPNTVEGLISLTSLSDDFYIFNQQHMILIGERTGKIFRIGQKVKVRVEKVDVDEREIDFKLVEAEPVEDANLEFLREEMKRQNARREKRRRDEGGQNRPSRRQGQRSQGKGRGRTSANRRGREGSSMSGQARDRRRQRRHGRSKK